MWMVYLFGVLMEILANRIHVSLKFCMIYLITVINSTHMFRNLEALLLIVYWIGLGFLFDRMAVMVFV